MHPSHIYGLPSLLSFGHFFLIIPKEHCKVAIFPKEQMLIEAFIQILNETDPDIVSGYDMEKYSLSFIASRAEKLG